MSRDPGNKKAIGRVMVPSLNRVLIGERLQALRLARGWKGKPLAEAIGIPHGSIGAIENGHMLPDPQRLLAFATAFGVSIDFILTGKLLTCETTDGAGGSDRQGNG